MISATTTVAIAWPATSKLGETGVARRRLSTPVSRRLVIEMTRLAYAATTIDIARMPGT